MIWLLVRVGWLIGWLCFLPWHVVRRLAARVPRGTHLLVEVDGVVDEVPAPPTLWPPAAGRARTFSLQRLATLVDETARDQRVRGLIIVIKSMRAGFATSTSFRRIVQRARAHGKRVTVYLPQGGGTREMYVAAAAAEAVLGPQAVLACVGLLSSARYVRGALDRAGVVPEVHAHGRFKTAAESIERTAMSDAQREQLDAILGGFYGELVRAIAEGRRMEDDQARASIDNAPYVGGEAVDAGLADHVAYEDEIPSRLAEDARPPSVRPAEPYLRGRTALRPGALRSAGSIAVLRIHGTIAGAVGLPLSTLAVDERVIAAARLARASPVVRGVVLHVDSPGGSALASDRIHHELALLAAKKPLVACMGDVAASGGYYVAAAAHEIVAQPTTITGSIGVIGARFVLDPLLTRFGVATHALQRGAHAKLLDPFLPLGDSEKRAIDREIEHMYRAFVKVVAVGRSRTVEEIEPVAQGRVWLGAEAHRQGLVDRLGGFEDALEAVRGRIGKGAGSLRVVVVRPPRRSSTLFEPPDSKAERMVARAIETAAGGLGIDPALLVLARDRVLAWCPSSASLRW